MFTLQFDTANDAFAETPASEIAAILRKLAGKIESGSVFYSEDRPVIDSNGNRIGTWKIEE